MCGGSWRWSRAPRRPSSPRSRAPEGTRRGPASHGIRLRPAPHRPRSRRRVTGLQDEDLPMTAVDLARAFASITTHWDPHIAGELNGQYVKCVKFAGEFVWHKHDVEDELFLVYRGSMERRLRNGRIT